MPGAVLSTTPRYIFTAPWEPVLVRRGDALGLLALADQFAERVAPQLSNRINDGRWVTIVAWCLARSQEMFHAGGGRGVVTQTEARSRYAWLRPLELMWVARTIGLTDGGEGRPLSGKRRITPWYYSGGKRDATRFGMTPDQFRAYRQTGMYGAYRLAFRKWPSMTVGGDGWTPGSNTNQLAKWLDAKLGNGRPPRVVGDDAGLGRIAKLNRDKEAQWWYRQWSPTFDLKGGGDFDKNTLPRRREDHGVLLEAHLLKPIIFGNDKAGKQRLDTAKEVGKSGAENHIEICEHLAEVFGKDHAAIKLLPCFSRLADAGMAVMDFIAEALSADSRIPLAHIATRPGIKTLCKDLSAAAKEWTRQADMQLRHIDTAHRFANAFPSSQPMECLEALLLYHEQYGGGLRWFVLRDGQVEARTPQSRTASSAYRFRLRPLCRLAAQCGILRSMPPALRSDAESEAEETSDGTDE